MLIFIFLVPNNTPQMSTSKNKTTTKTKTTKEKIKDKKQNNQKQTKENHKRQQWINNCLNQQRLVYKQMTEYIEYINTITVIRILQHISHRWCNSQRTHIETGRSWFQARWVKPPKIVNLASVASPLQHAALRRKSQSWLTRNQDNMSEWSAMHTNVQLFQ